jgi:hypothetical protein
MIMKNIIGKIIMVPIWTLCLIVALPFALISLVIGPKNK